MQCTACSTEIPSSFKHALEQNVCPGCGGQIMDEESLVVIEDLKSTIAAAATVRPQTAEKLAMAIFFKYDVSLPEEEMAGKKAVKRGSKLKEAPASEMRKVIESEEEAGIIKAEDMAGISDAERESMLEAAVKDKYNMVDQIQASAGDFPTVDPSYDRSNDAAFSEGEVNPFLEKERMARLTKQKQAMEGGGNSSFRRSG